MTTIKDIATKLGVSSGTVSKGLNGADDISESMRNKILETAGGRAQVLLIFARQVVRRIVLSAYRTAAQMSVGVEGRSGTDSCPNGVAQGIYDSEINGKIMLSARRSVGHLQMIHAVEIESVAESVVSSSSTECSVYGIAHSVEHHEVYSNYAVAAMNGAEAVGVETCGVIWFAVVVDGVADADTGMQRNKESVVHRKVYHQIVVTAVGGT